jgi:hypothetical protein
VQYFPCFGTAQQRGNKYKRVFSTIDYFLTRTLPELESYVRVVLRQQEPTVGKDTTVNVFLTLQENPVTPARQLARDNDIISHATVLRILRSAKLHPYKMQMVQELA